MSYRHPSIASLLSELRDGYVRIAESPILQLVHAGEHAWDRRRRIDNDAYELMRQVSGSRQEFSIVPSAATHEQILAWLDEAIALAQPTDAGGAE